MTQLSQFDSTYLSLDKKGQPNYMLPKKTPFKYKGSNKLKIKGWKITFFAGGGFQSKE